LPDLLQNRTYQWAFGYEFHSGLVHLAEQRLPGSVHEIHICKIDDGPASIGRGTGRPPAELQFPNPRSGQTALEMEAELLGGIVECNFEHGQYPELFVARRLPEWKVPHTSAMRAAAHRLLPK
jgi:hypothetical protein